MNDQQKRAFDFVLSLRGDYGEYHHKKEQAAYAVAVLYLGAVATMVMKPVWRDWPVGERRVLLLVWALASVFAIWFVSWQLWNRRCAAMMVSAATTVAADWIHRSPTEAEYEPVVFGRERWPRALVTQLRRLRGRFWVPIFLTITPLILGAAMVGRAIEESAGSPTAVSSAAAYRNHDTPERPPTPYLGPAWLPAVTAFISFLAFCAAVWYAREATRQTEIQVRPYLLLETSGPSAYLFRVVNVGNGTAHSLEFEAIEIPPPRPTPIHGVPIAPIDVVRAGGEGELRCSDVPLLADASEGVGGSLLSISLLERIAPNAWLTLVVRYRDLFGDSYQAGWRLRGQEIESLPQWRVHRRWRLW